MKNFKKNIMTNQSQNTRVIVSIDNYNLESDNRLLIPFLETRYTQNKWGLFDKEGNVVVDAKYDTMLNEFYSSDDIVLVGTLYPHGYARSGGRVASYVKYKYNAIDVDGNIINETAVDDIIISTDKKLLTLKNELSYAVCDRSGQIIVPFGKYSRIDGYHAGLARAINYNNQFGVINESGEEVIPFIYHRIWKFYGSEYDSMIVEEWDETSEQRQMEDGQPQKKVRRYKIYFDDLSTRIPVDVKPHSGPRPIATL